MNAPQPLHFEIKLYDLHQPDPAEDYLLGTIDLFGKPHHVEALRVQMNANDEQEPTRDPNRRYEDLQTFLGLGFCDTVQIPGWDGLWVVYVTPFIF